MLSQVDHKTHTTAVLQVPRAHLLAWDHAAGTSPLLLTTTSGSLLVVTHVALTQTAVEASAESVSTQVTTTSCRRLAEANSDTGLLTRFVVLSQAMVPHSTATQDSLLHRTIC
jgi:hypothetical protein